MPAATGRLWTCDVEDRRGKRLGGLQSVRKGRRCSTARRESASTEQPLPRAAKGCVKWPDQLGPLSGSATGPCELSALMLLPSSKRNNLRLVGVAASAARLAALAMRL